MEVVVCSSSNHDEDDSHFVTGIGRQMGYPVTPLHSGSRFKGYQQSKGNKYQVEVILQVCLTRAFAKSEKFIFVSLQFQYVDQDNDLISGYLKIQGLTEVKREHLKSYNHY